MCINCLLRDLEQGVSREEILPELLQLMENDTDNNLLGDLSAFFWSSEFENGNADYRTNRLLAFVQLFRASFRAQNAFSFVPPSGYDSSSALETALRETFEVEAPPQPLEALALLQLSNAPCGISNQPCPICLESAADPDLWQAQSVRLACRHEYHLSCIQTWGAQRNTCPVCRVPIRCEEEPPPPEEVAVMVAAEGEESTAADGLKEDEEDYGLAKRRTRTAKRLQEKAGSKRTRIGRE